MNLSTSSCMLAAGVVSLTLAAGCSLTSKIETQLDAQASAIAGVANQVQQTTTDVRAIGSTITQRYNTQNFDPVTLWIIVGGSVIVLPILNYILPKLALEKLRGKPPQG